MARLHLWIVQREIWRESGGKVQWKRREVGFGEIERGKGELGFGEDRC